MAGKVKCIVCGTEYDYCPNCAEFKDAPSWLAEYDTENCKDIWLTLNQFAFNHITKEQALDVLKDKDLSKSKEYPADLQRVLARLYDKKKKETKNGD